MDDFAVTPVLEILDVGPGVTLQDLGRVGHLASGLTRGGAMDRLALHEAAALLAQPVSAALEMIGVGGSFRASVDTRIALTGAPMVATIDGQPVAWHGSYLLAAGSLLRIGGVKAGSIGYLSVGGGFAVSKILGAQSAHLVAGLGGTCCAGQTLALGHDTQKGTEMMIVPSDRFSGGEVGITSSLQTHLFGDQGLQCFTQTLFTRDARANRQGIRLNPQGQGFVAADALNVVSEIIVPGDIQVTGDGSPYVLMCESQSTGGYPRIATVLPSDLPWVAQAPLGATVRFRHYGLDQAVARESKARATRAALRSRVVPRVRDPHTVQDLLAYSLISGVVSATDNPFAGGAK